MKHLTGNDAPVCEFLSKYPQTFEFLKKECQMLDFLIPQYESEGKSQLVISVGCTGGQHRSVFIANKLYDYLRLQSYHVELIHRDLSKKA
jgi:RNase adapter protein RapZ